MERLTIKQIEMKIFSIQDENDEFIKYCKQDNRKGVQALIQRWQKKIDEEIKLRSQFKEMCRYEEELYSKGITRIAGVDEVGRGPLAGPVVAAAVILPIDFYLPGLNDSKKLSEAKREELYTTITKEAIAIGIGIISAEKIDEVNIYQATKLAMKKAILELKVNTEHVFADAMEIPINIPQTSIIKGDSKSISIAASSIIAKVTRDRMMKRLSIQYPQYGFDKHMGYGTSYHLEALKNYGATEEHRKTFAPVKDVLILSQND